MSPTRPIRTPCWIVPPSQVVHLAAETGTAQSLSQATRHGSVNVVGTTQLLDALSRAELVPDQLVLASSRAVYGEGAWRSGTHLLPSAPEPRTAAGWHLGSRGTDGPNPRYRFRTAPAKRSPGRPTFTAPPSWLKSTCWPPGPPRMTPNSVSAAAKRLRARPVADQSVYGSGSFLGWVIARETPSEVYEDGRIVRDLVYIDDVVDALFAAMQQPPAE